MGNNGKLKSAHGLLQNAMQQGGHFPLCGLAGSHLDTRAKTCGVSPLRLIHRDYQIGRSSSLTHSYHTTTPEIPSPSPLCRGQWNEKHNCSHSAEVLPEGTVSRRQWKMQGIHTIGTPPPRGPSEETTRLKVRKERFFCCHLQ